MEIRGDFVAFGALMFITGTGLALMVVGSCLLSWAAYLSPWLPSWVWMTLAGFTGLGVAIAASSAACAIATVAPKPQAAHKCLVLLLVFLALEIMSSAMSAVRQPAWSLNLYHSVQKNMQESLDVYSTNSSAAAMWDEIQNEVECCGVVDYNDWFTSGFGDGMSVPDSCCLLPSTGCGAGIRSHSDIDDYISTQGCLPVLSSGWSKSYRMISRQAFLPICVIQVIMVTVIVLTLRSMGRLAGHLPVLIRNPTASKPQHYSLMT
ncbi:CD63 antigen [Hyalella azteca]|uniref:CD63 antigen n=1 Tax=Hyalella azteca TaxID=294128 RepID=A0A8B7PN81_HYAAZ|nr:CD63 antigen [Hyalella azteca]